MTANLPSDRMNLTLRDLLAASCGLPMQKWVATQKIFKQEHI